MEAQRIIKILNTHCIENRTNRKGRILALNAGNYNGKSATQWFDVTNWTSAELRTWLGY